MVLGVNLAMLVAGTGESAKQSSIWRLLRQTSTQESSVEVRRKRCREPGFSVDRRVLGVVLAHVLTEGMAERVEIEPLIAVLLTVWRAGAPVMKANGKSRINGVVWRSAYYDVK
jgi:hypothetical protein